MWGVVPAAGQATRIQPLAFSKELLPVGSRVEDGRERPRAVSEYLVDRMISAGADRICFVISPHKGDIVGYFGAGVGSARFCYTVQQNPAGLCDAVFTALPLVAPEDHVLVGLPDTVWFPEDGFARLPDEPALSFLLFPVDDPRPFDAVLTDDRDRVTEILVKRADAPTRWIWGGFKVRGSALAELHELWLARRRQDAYVGSLVNAWLGEGGKALGVRAGDAYVDVGTLDGYRKALALLQVRRAETARPSHEG
jgi:glucose-1-phosphate thymidylyltransferase